MRLGKYHRVITVIEEQRLVVLGCTALFSKVGQLYIHMRGGIISYLYRQNKGRGPTAFGRIRTIVVNILLSTVTHSSVVAACSADQMDAGSNLFSIYIFFFIPNLKNVGSNSKMKYSHPSSPARVCTLAAPW